MTSRSLARLCVFCGTNSGTRPEYVEAARRFGTTIAREGITLVYGGGSVGVMGQLANAVLEHDGHVTGIIPSGLTERELAHTGISDLIVVGSMHERKQQMASLADGFVGLPGGLGTLEEWFEVLTWAQLGIHTKPCGLLNVAGYFDQIRGFFDHAVEEGFLLPEHRSMILIEDDGARLLERMRSYEAPAVEKWAGRT